MGADVDAGESRSMITRAEDSGWSHDSNVGSVGVGELLD